MVVNPCCMPLQKGVTIMAIIDIVIDVLNIGIAIMALIGITVYRDDLRSDVTDKEVSVAIGILILYLILAILGLLLSIRLYYGAKRRDIRNCRIWLIVSSILLVLNIISAIINGTSGETNTANLVISIIQFAYTLYMIWVVYCFIEELKLDQQGLAFEARLENGVGYSMHQYPPQYPQNPPPYPTGQYPGQFQPQPNYGVSVITTTTGQPIQNGQGGLYNPNSQFNNSNNVL